MRKPLSPDKLIFISQLFGLIVQENIPLAPLTTLEVGGPARYFVSCTIETDIISALEFAREKGLPIFVLGGGSNVVVSDKGFDGVVIEIAIDRSQNRIMEDLGRSFRRITVGAGENWDSFVKFCVENDLSGVECLSGIPGSVGGTPVQNVGAYGQEVSETVEWLRCIDSETGQPLRLANDQCGFSYRQSIFNSTRRNRYIIYDVTFKLVVSGAPKIAYKDLIEHFAGRKPSLRKTRDAVLSIRRSKSMVIDDKDENRRSVGSFFKNPVVSKGKYDEIAGDSSSNVPHFPAFQGNLKIPAAWLIEHAGFPKGYAKGNVGISTNHTLAIVNRGGASSAEIVGLKNEIQSVVSQRFGVDLVPEPIFIGDF